MEVTQSSGCSIRATRRSVCLGDIYTDRPTERQMRNPISLTKNEGGYNTRPEKLTARAYNSGAPGTGDGSGAPGTRAPSALTSMWLPAGLLGVHWDSSGPLLAIFWSKENGHRFQGHHVLPCRHIP